MTPKPTQCQNPTEYPMHPECIDLAILAGLKSGDEDSIKAIKTYLADSADALQKQKDAQVALAKALDKKW